MNKIILLTDKSWHDDLFKNLSSEKHAIKCIRVKKKEKFNLELCRTFSPDWIFIPHWSYKKIPKEIFNNYRCVVFHMTDLPYGRGGTPLQNLNYKRSSDYKNFCNICY